MKNVVVGDTFDVSLLPLEGETDRSSLWLLAAQAGACRTLRLFVAALW